MRGHYRLGRLFGIDIRLHVTFVLIVIWAAWQGWREDGWVHAGWSALFVLCVFAGIVAHELGHSLAARRYGIVAHSITLYPIGGVAGLSRLPPRPSHEIVVAMAGPAVSLAIALALLALRGWSVRWDVLVRGPSSVGGLIEALAVANGFLAAFNLIPAFPMDGGRVLRAALTPLLGYERATAVAALAGQVFAVGFAWLGIALKHPFLVALAVFLAFVARREVAMVRARMRLQNLRVADVADRSAPVVPALTSVEEAMTRYLADVDEALVGFEGRPVGLVDRPSLLRALRERGPDWPVEAVMRRSFLAVPYDGRLSEMIVWLPRTGQQIYPVVWNGELVGVLRLADVLREAGLGPRPSGWAEWSIDLG